MTSQASRRIDRWCNIDVCRHLDTTWSQTRWSDRVGPNSNTRTRTARPPKIPKPLLAPPFQLDPILAVANASRSLQVLALVVTTTRPSARPAITETVARVLTTRRTRLPPLVDCPTVPPTVTFHTACKKFSRNADLCAHFTKF